LGYKKKYRGICCQKYQQALSIPISLVLARIGIHPNVLTALSFGIALFGGSLLWRVDTGISWQRCNIPVYFHI